jgi:hypothetical protein
MFEVGKRYEFKMVDEDGHRTFWGVVERYEHPLLKLEDTKMSKVRIHLRPSQGPASEQTIGGDETYPGEIINVTSSSFVSAVEKEAPKF